MFLHILFYLRQRSHSQIGRSDESCKWMDSIVSCNSLFGGNTRLPQVTMWRLPPYASFPFGVIDRCCSLFIWLGFNNMKPIARSGACCCLYGPLSVSCPLNEKWEKERRQMNQRCVIYYEKRLNGNRATSKINTDQRAESLQDGVRTPNKKLLLFTPSLSLLRLLFTTTSCLFFKAFRLVLVLTPPPHIKYESDIIGYGLHALPFLANPTKAAGGSSKFLGRADNVEMLTTANLSRVSDLRTTAGDREHVSNGFQLFSCSFVTREMSALAWKILSELVGSLNIFKLGWM